MLKFVWHHVIHKSMDGSRPLLTRFPALRHVALASLPTPVDAAPMLGPGVWVKRDDLTGSAAVGYGGNKVRKLEFLLAEALHAGRRSVMTIGAAGSNHVLATTLYARAAGLAHTAAVLFPQPPSPAVDARRALFAELGLSRVEVPGKLAVPLGALWLGVRALATGHGWPMWIPTGGSSPTGALGYVNAALELADQVAAGTLPVPSRLYVPLGSAGTVAGLVVGLRLAGLATRVVAVQVVPRPWMTAGACLRLARRTAEKLGAPPPVAADLEVETAQLGGGYGETTPAADAAAARAAEAGLALETTYGAKALAALLAAKRGEDVLFWHTFSRYGPRA
jgi:D-cysteine desulfhydrase